ncbi:MAG: hypothetical protein IPM94_07100 [bacterium]|nr:hypothetical protein [bacterium]
MRLPDWVVGRLTEPAWDLYEGSVRLRTFRQLARAQFDPPEALAQRRQERLGALVRHAAAHSPFHARRLREAGIDPRGVRDIADLGALPLLTKADIRGGIDDILARDHRREDLVPAKTGGSTGTALHVYCDRRGVERRSGAALLADTWSGWRLGQPMGAVWGNPPAPRTLRNRLRLACKDRIVYLDTMRLDEAAVRGFVAGWRRLRPGLLYGHAHSLYLLAGMLEEMGETLRPDGIVATSMMLLQPEREVIERVFARPVTNRYGCEEVSLIACECERHEGLHLNAEHAAVELLRDDGSPCSPGRGRPDRRDRVREPGHADAPLRGGRPRRAARPALLLRPPLAAAALGHRPHRRLPGGGRRQPRGRHLADREHADALPRHRAAAGRPGGRRPGRAERGARRRLGRGGRGRAGGRLPRLAGRGRGGPALRRDHPPRGQRQVPLLDLPGARRAERGMSVSRRILLGLAAAIVLLGPFVVPVPGRFERMPALRSLGVVAHWGCRWCSPCCCGRGVPCAGAWRRPRRWPGC